MSYSASQRGSGATAGGGGARRAEKTSSLKSLVVGMVPAPRTWALFRHAACEPGIWRLLAPLARRACSFLRAGACRLTMRQWPRPECRPVPTEPRREKSGGSSQRRSADDRRDPRANATRTGTPFRPLSFRCSFHGFFSALDTLGPPLLLYPGFELISRMGFVHGLYQTNYHLYHTSTAPRRRPVRPYARCTCELVSGVGALPRWESARQKRCSMW